MEQLLSKVPRFLFFTGKGGVGKTSMSSLIASTLASQGKKVLLISTDPASNLDEVLETKLTNKPVEIGEIPNLFAMNIDPLLAAQEYKERIVGPFRGVLPEDAVASIEEQLSGACTVEIASFNEFSQIIGNEETVANYDHIVLDTAPTGHTLRLLSLPAAWNDFILENKSGSSCLGPMSGLQAQRKTYEAAVNSLSNPKKTLLILVARAEAMTLTEAGRASKELWEQGMQKQHLIINGIFTDAQNDRVAKSLVAKSEKALTEMPENLKKLETTKVPFYPKGVVGVDTLRAISQNTLSKESTLTRENLTQKRDEISSLSDSWKETLDSLAQQKSGLIMTMGKGGVGKTSMAAAIAIALAQRGEKVHLSTTDPAAHIADTVGENISNLTISCINPKEETEKYVTSVLDKNRELLSAEDLDLLEEELRSPCIEEIAVFQAFAQAVHKGKEQFMVLDTAPTGHTLLLLDATEAYHKEVAKSGSELSEAVQELLPRLRDPNFTKVFITTLPEATPVHEAQRLQEDLKRAGIVPYGWIVNGSFAFSQTNHPLLLEKGKVELSYLQEITKELSQRTLITPWMADTLVGKERLLTLVD